MNFRLLARLVVALGVFLSGASYSSATQVYKGTSHDHSMGCASLGLSNWLSVMPG